MNFLRSGVLSFATQVHCQMILRVIMFGFDVGVCFYAMNYCHNASHRVNLMPFVQRLAVQQKTLFFKFVTLSPMIVVKSCIQAETISYQSCLAPITVHSSLLQELASHH